MSWRLRLLFQMINQTYLPPRVGVSAVLEVVSIFMYHLAAFLIVG